MAVQIADSISEGESIRGFKLEAEKQKVLSFDFEMSDKQFEKRYSVNCENHYNFGSNFLRVEINPDCTTIEDFETALFNAVEKAITEYETKILIIDNLTYLKTQATDTAKEALPLMKLLKELKLKYDESVTVFLSVTIKNLTIIKLYSMNTKIITTICSYCEAEFSAKRSTATYLFCQLPPNGIR